MDLEGAVKYYEAEIIDSLRRVVAIDSCQGEEKPGKPFGEGPAAALAETLQIAKELGFDTVVNLDNYAGYVQMGEGEEVIGILGHVDIVPAGEGWSYPAFGGEIHDGWIYGRGVSDDKGPVIVALYALKILKDAGVRLKKRVRLVVGANEETGFACMKHYREVEGGFTYGFTPDADFPLIFGEKGSYNGYFSGSKKTSGKIEIVELKGGAAKNIVAQNCTATLKADGEAQNIKNALDKFSQENGCKYAVNEENGLIKINITGIPAHASTPELGLNAISLMMKFLGEITEGSSFVEGYNKAVGMSYDGEGCGVKYSDEYGALTFNVGLISTSGDTVNATIDIRYPLTTLDFSAYAQKIAEKLTQSGLVLDGYDVGKPLYVDPESEFVKMLYRAYTNVTGDNENKPFTIGGGTYAKAFDNVVAFGCEFPNSGPYNIHAADERACIEEMKQCLRIYVKALMYLNEI